MELLLVSADRTCPDGHAANLGDAFLTDVLRAALQSRGHVVTTADFGSAARIGPDRRTRLRGAVGLARAIRASSGVVVGGGTLLQDDGSRLGLGGLPRLMLAVSALSWILRTPMVFIGVGCDPVSRGGARLLLRLAVWRRPVWAREAESVDRVRTMLRTRAVLGADVSLLAVGAGLLPLPSPGTATCLALNAGHRSQAESVARRLEPSATGVVFLPMDLRAGAAGDRTLLPLLSARIPTTVADQPLTWPAAAAIVASSSVVLASRMHALYLALMLGKPAVAVGRLPKVRSFAVEFGVPIWDPATGPCPTARPGDAVRAAAAAARAEQSLVDALRHLTQRATTP